MSLVQIVKNHPILTIGIVHSHHINQQTMLVTLIHTIPIIIQVGDVVKAMRAGIATMN
tara:strand:- start:2306 stop:2479 length:174 start_codon:yes stop_codon:yes gene_type:complete